MTNQQLLEDIYKDLSSHVKDLAEKHLVSAAQKHMDELDNNKLEEFLNALYSVTIDEISVLVCEIGIPADNLVTNAFVGSNWAKYFSKKFELARQLIDLSKKLPKPFHNSEWVGDDMHLYNKILKDGTAIELSGTCDPYINKEDEVEFSIVPDDDVRDDDNFYWRDYLINHGADGNDIMILTTKYDNVLNKVKINDVDKISKLIKIASSLQ